MRHTEKLTGWRAFRCGAYPPELSDHGDRYTDHQRRQDRSDLSPRELAQCAGTASRKVASSCATGAGSLGGTPSDWLRRPSIPNQGDAETWESWTARSRS